MADWDDPEYELPASNSRYTKLENGKLRFRVLSPRITGSVGWTEKDGKRRPVRKRDGVKFAPREVLQDEKNQIRHFWAFAIWNYKTGRVEVFEITQRTIQEPMLNLLHTPEYGPPTGYDIEVERSEVSGKVKYSVLAYPPRPAAAEILAAWSEVEPAFDLNRLYDSGNPFGGDAEADAPRAGQDRDTTIKAIMATVSELWPEVPKLGREQATTEIKKRLLEQFAIKIESFKTATLQDLTAVYRALKLQLDERTSGLDYEDQATGTDDDLPF